MAADARTEQNAASMVAGADAFYGPIERCLTAQYEIAEVIQRANQHWLQQTQSQWMGALELARKLQASDTPSNKMTAFQTWLKGTLESGMDELRYAIDASRELGSAELKLFAGRESEHGEAAGKAA